MLIMKNLTPTDKLERSCNDPHFPLRSKTNILQDPLKMLRFIDATTSVQTRLSHLLKVSHSWDWHLGSHPRGCPQTASLHVRCQGTQVGRPCPNIQLTMWCCTVQYGKHQPQLYTFQFKCIKIKYNLKFSSSVTFQVLPQPHVAIVWMLQIEKRPSLQHGTLVGSREKTCDFNPGRSGDEGEHWGLVTVSAMNWGKVQPAGHFLPSLLSLTFFSKKKQHPSSVLIGLLFLPTLHPTSDLPLA